LGYDDSNTIVLLATGSEYEEFRSKFSGKLIINNIISRGVVGRGIYPMEENQAEIFIIAI